MERAAAQAKQTQYLRAALNLRKAFNGYEDNVKAYPNFFDSYKGIGLAHTVVGSVPKTYRDVLGVIGFDGTVSQGLAELKTAARKSEYSQEEAALLLSMMDLMINSKKANGISEFAKVYKRYPNSPMTGTMYAFLLVKYRRVAEAEPVLKKALAGMKRPGVTPIDYATFLDAEADMLRGRYAQAERTFIRYTNQYDGHALRARAFMTAGQAAELDGRRADAVSHYKKVKAWRDFDSDKAAKRRADEAIKTPMTAAEKTLQRAHLAYDAGRYREAVELVQPLLVDKGVSEDERAQAAYRTGRAYQALESWDESLRHFQFATGLPGKGKEIWAPWSQYYIGEVYEAQGKEARGARGLRKGARLGRRLRL